MSDRMHFKDFLAILSTKAFEATGIPLISLLKIGALLVVVLLGSGLAVLYINAEHDGEVSRIEGGESKRLTSDKQLLEDNERPADFAQKHPFEKIHLLKSKIVAGEELAKSDSPYAERATDQLVLIYGTLCQLQDLEGIGSQESYARLAELRQQASAAGNGERVGMADFFRAFAATNRLFRSTERADFHFAADAVLKIDSKELVNTEHANLLYRDAIKLHDTSSKQGSTAIYLSILGEKFYGSPVRAISNLGLKLKDHVNYDRYYAAIDKLPDTTRESKLQFYNEMIAEIQKNPPQSPITYRVIFRLIDRLVSSSDANIAATLTKRLAKAASMMSPEIRARVDQSIKNIERRIATLGKTVDLSGSKFDGSPLRLPNDRPTTLVFWRLGDEESTDYIQLLANSDRFDPWETNVLMASLAPLSEKELGSAEELNGKFTVLDNATSRRMGIDIGIDLVPYQVSLDKDGKVIRLGDPRD